MGAFGDLANFVYRDGVPSDKRATRALLAAIDLSVLPTPKVFGAWGDGSNDKVAIQEAIDTMHAGWLVDGVSRTLWFDDVYTVGGTKHSNGFSIIDLKSGVNFDGPGGLRLADNTNVAESSFTATFSGTTMTIVSIASGVSPSGKFITAAGNVLPAATKTLGQLTGSGFVVGATFQTSVNCGTIASPVAVNAIGRMVELMGNYSSSPYPGIVDTCYRNILLDYNGENNCAGGTIWSFNSTISINTADGVVFDSLRFRDNCGSNDIVLGLLQPTLTAFRCRVVNCSFQNVSTRVNPSARDYSTIVANGAHLGIFCNTFTLGPTLNGVALELYGQNVNAVGNTVSGYWAFSNIAGLPGQISKNIKVSGNTVQDCSVGIVLWTMDASAQLRGVLITKNSFDCNVSAPGGPYFINGITQVTTGSQLRNILIEGNVFQNNDISDTARNVWGIGLKAVLSAKIIGNKLYGISGEGIYITGSVNPCAIDITNNHLIDVGYTVANAANKTGITIDASGSTGTLMIQGNVINPIDGYTLTYGIKNGLGVSVGKIQNNVILLATTPVANTGAGVEVDAVYGDGYGPSSGGTVTQATSKSTAVTLNKLCGQIAMNGAAIAAGATVSFVLTNSKISATDVPCFKISAGATAGAYRDPVVDQVSNGSCRVSITNGSAGSLSEALVLNFTVLKGSST